MGIEKFNNSLHLWVTEIDKFTLLELLIKPDANSWSLGQLYEHIIEETSWYNHQIEISLADKENAGIETSQEAKLLFKAGSFADKKIQGDPYISENVKQPKSIIQLKYDLERLKKDTNALWQKMNNVTNTGKSEHPGIGFLNCFEWLHYAEMHMRHHLRQKERIELFLNKPATTEKHVKR